MSDENDIEIDEENNVTKDKVTPTMEHIKRRLKEAATPYVEKYRRRKTENEKISADAEHMIAMNKIAMWGAPKIAFLDRNVPGFSKGTELVHKLNEKLQPKPVRQPVSMSRDFPDTVQGNKDKESYIRMKLIERARELADKGPKE